MPSLQRPIPPNSKLYKSIRKLIFHQAADGIGPMEVDGYYSEDPFWRGTFFIRVRPASGRTVYFMLRDHQRVWNEILNKDIHKTPVRWDASVVVRSPDDASPRKAVTDDVEVIELDLKRWPPRMPNVEASVARRKSGRRAGEVQDILAATDFLYGAADPFRYNRRTGPNSRNDYFVRQFFRFMNKNGRVQIDVDPALLSAYTPKRERTYAERIAIRHARRLAESLGRVFGMKFSAIETRGSDGELGRVSVIASRRVPAADMKRLAPHGAEVIRRVAFEMLRDLPMHQGGDETHAARRQLGLV